MNDSMRTNERARIDEMTSVATLTDRLLENRSYDDWYTVRFVADLNIDSIVSFDV